MCPPRACTSGRSYPCAGRKALSFSLPRKVDHERIIRKVMEYHGRFCHVANLRVPGDLDDRLRGWLTEAYLASPT